MIDNPSIRNIQFLKIIIILSDTSAHGREKGKLTRQEDRGIGDRACMGRGNSTWNDTTARKGKWGSRTGSA